MGIEIQLVVSPRDRLDVYRFRYKIYVEEMQRKQPGANHEDKLVVDFLDTDASNLFIARADGEIVGTVRSSYLRTNSAGHYEQLYRLPGHVENRWPLSITTRLMTAVSYRGSKLVVNLALATYSQGLVDGIEFDFIDCNSHLVDFFEKLGYVFLRFVTHPDYGPVALMRLSMLDIDHLTAVRSPFLPILRRHLEPQGRELKQAS